MEKMARSVRQSPSSLIELLFQEPYRFDFFQAVRILEQAARRGVGRPQCNQPIGRDSHPREEVVRFRSAASLSFPASAIQELKSPESEKNSQENAVRPPEMTVNFMGLTGPCGALPQHYTERLIRTKGESFRDFLDIFNHRTISLFYRAWRKYRLTACYEHGDGSGTDPISALISALIGFGTRELSGRMAIPERVLLFYAGHLSRTIRPAVVLEAVLSDYFDVGVKIEQFRGRRVELPCDQQSALPSSEHPNGVHAELGINTMIGDHVWDAGGAFRICIGPVSYKYFVTFMPDAKTGRLIELAHLTRIFVGPEFDFDAQVILDKAEVPCCRLVGDDVYQPRLGWNTWLVTEPLDEDNSDAVFTVDRSGYS